MKKIYIMICLLMLWGTAFCDSAHSRTIYVKYDASGLNNGTSWTNAYKDLQNGLSAAAIGDEIWVAKGIYRPTVVIGRVPDITDRAKTFLIKNGVSIYGGFSGIETGLSQRNPDSNITVLSGDIDKTGTDGITDSNNTYNSYHVVKVNTGTNCTLDGFIISQGNGNYIIGNNDRGGGLHIDGSADNEIIINKLKFIHNNANDGGAIYVSKQKIELTNCIFRSNIAGSGGAIESDNEYTYIFRTIFQNNLAWAYGGTIFHAKGYLEIEESSFTESKSDIGGILYILSSEISIKNSLLSNSISFNGGAIYVYNSKYLNISNSTIFGNIVDSNGGGILAIYTPVKLINSTIASNYCGTNGFYSGEKKGGGINLYNSASLTIINTILSNNFFKDKTGSLYNDDCVRGNTSTVTSLGHNIVTSFEPSSDFTYEKGDIITSDPRLGPLQDNGGFTQTMAICSGSPAKDAGVSSVVTSDITIPVTDQRGNPRSGSYDIGAYENLYRIPGNPVTKPVDSQYISANTATASGQISLADISATSFHGMFYSTTNKLPGKSDANVDGEDINSSTGIFYAQLKNLAQNTLYYIRSYIAYSDGCSAYSYKYGEMKSFTTKADVPVIVWNTSLENTTPTTTELSGNISNYNSNISYYYCIRTSADFDSAISYSLSTTGGSFSIKKEDLNPSTVYYIWVYAKNNEAIPAYNDTYRYEIQTGPQTDKPILEIQTPAIIGSATVTLKATVIDFGKYDTGLVDYGFILSKNEDFMGVTPLIRKQMSPPATSNYGDFSLNIDGLESDTLYYAKAYGVNSKGIEYSNVISFSTAPELPVATMTGVSNIGSRTATLNGNIDILSGVVDITYGFVWGISPEPELSNALHYEFPSKTSSDKIFSYAIAALLPYHIYYARAFGRNSAGNITYSEDIVFITSSEAPEVETLSVQETDISDNSVILRAIVKNSGASAGGTIFGFIISTIMADSPDTSVFFEVPVSGSADSFSYEFNYIIGKQYEFRAYAKNSAGTGYGDIKSFGNILKGDVNADGTVSLVDAVIALKVIAGISVSSVSLDSDVNADGKIGVEEAVYILRNTSGL